MSPSDPVPLRITIPTGILVELEEAARLLLKTRGLKLSVADVATVALVVGMENLVPEDVGGQPDPETAQLFMCRCCADDKGYPYSSCESCGKDFE